MAITNQQGKLILTNASNQRVAFSVTGNTLGTTGINLDSTIVTSNLVSWWKFEENTNASNGILDHAFTDTGIGANPGNHGTKFGTAGVVTGPTNDGNGFDFSGDDYIEITSTTGLSMGSGTEWTYEVWIKNATGLGGGESFALTAYAGSNDTCLIALTSTNIVTYFGGDGRSNLYGSTTYNNANWNQIAATFKNDGSANNAKVYVNGALVNTYTVASQTTATDPQVWFGNFKGVSNFITAYLDEYKIYSRRLSGGEILQNYNYYQ